MEIARLFCKNFENIDGDSMGMGERGCSRLAGCRYSQNFVLKLEIQ